MVFYVNVLLITSVIVCLAVTALVVVKSDQYAKAPRANLSRSMSSQCKGLDLVIVERGSSLSIVQHEAVYKHMPWIGKLIVVNATGSGNSFAIPDVPANGDNMPKPVVIQLSVRGPVSDRALLDELPKLVPDLGDHFLYLGSQIVPVNNVDMSDMFDNLGRPRLFKYDMDGELYVGVTSTSQLFNTANYAAVVSSLASTDDVVYAPFLSRGVDLSGNLACDNPQLSNVKKFAKFMSVNSLPKSGERVRLALDSVRQHL